MNPIKSLFNSRKFLLLLLDTILSGVVLFAGWYVAPEMLDRIIAVIALVQPLFVAVIVGIAVEDAAQKFNS